jgi:hypothetical protein
MKTSTFRIIPLPTEVADAARRAAAAGAADHAVITADSSTGYPCRHCLRWAQPGERVVLFDHGFRFASIDNFSIDHIERGIISAHYSPVAKVRRVFMRRGVTFAPLDMNEDRAGLGIRMTGRNRSVRKKLFQNPETAFVDARSVTRGCFTFRMQRA